MQRGSNNPRFSRLLADSRLCSGRSGSTMRLDFPWIAVPRQRRRVAKQVLQRPLRGLCQLPDGDYADLGQPCLGDRAHSPHQLDRQVVKEIELRFGIDNHQPVRLGHLIFARCLVRATPTEIGSPSSARTRPRIAFAISAGGPKRWDRACDASRRVHPNRSALHCAYIGAAS
jgi:hypothetical protein